MKRRVRKGQAAMEVMRWFFDSVTYEGERYEIDLEQAEAVADESLNTIVVARAGSGKTRTLVAKIVYLVAKCGVRPDEIMVFVFNANAAVEINDRLGRMRVNGESVVGNVKIASTFHAFSRYIIYDVCNGKEICKRILAGEKEDFIKKIVSESVKEKELSEEELCELARKMTSFINRAQQQFLNGEDSLGASVSRRLSEDDVDDEEKVFIELGLKVYNRYHWRLLRDERSDMEYGTDFNLIVSWASKLIRSGREEIRDLLANKKYILIDEYQDFSQLFFSEVEAIRQVAVSARLFAVGDDLQAINRFAGSEVKFFKEFERIFGEDARRLEITTNYRCDYLVVGAARRFMKKAMKEKGNFVAKSKSAGDVIPIDPAETELGFSFVDYDTRVSVVDKKYKEIVVRGMGRMPKKSTVQYFKTIVEILRKCCDVKDVLILHRNNDTNIEGISLDGVRDIIRGCLEVFGVMSGDEFDKKVQIMTIHKSKGLEAEVVIILEADEGVIPKMHPDTRLYGVFGETDEVALEDQMRLFYVAMTRAKKRLYIIHKKKNGKVGGFMKFL